MTRLEALAERLADEVVEAWDPSAQDMAAPRAVAERVVRDWLTEMPGPNYSDHLPD